jgi:uncharacterized membrane protein
VPVTVDSTLHQNQANARRAQTLRAVEEAASGGRAFFLMNAAATLIAGFGLFEDSPAVIIGAMLTKPRGAAGSD